jgi:small subunit ribosomal protein S13
MPRIVGVDVPNDKPAWIALSYIHGIGRYVAKKILEEAQIDGSVRAGKLNEDEVSRISQIIDRDHEVEGQLRRRVSQNISRLKDIACYRGIRHRRGLPVRGQQTQSNARTRKGKRKTVAGKKGVKEMR